MRRAGIWFVVFGVLSFTLPRFGYDLSLFEALGALRDGVATGLIVLGVALLVFAWQRKAGRAGSNR